MALKTESGVESKTSFCEASSGDEVAEKKRGHSLLCWMPTKTQPGLWRFVKVTRQHNTVELSDETQMWLFPVTLSDP